MTYTPKSKEEEQFLANYDPKKYDVTSLTADIVLLTIRQGKLCLLLIKRGGYPYKGQWALPGGFVQPDESADQAAERELKEETGIPVPYSHLEQLRTYSDPHRDPRMRVVSTAYLAFLPDLPEPEAGDDASNAHFFPVEDIFAKDEGMESQLAFDHATIIRDGLKRAKDKLEYTSLAMDFLPEKFTLSDLRRVYEAVWHMDLHPANFRRKILSTPGFVHECGEKGKGALGGNTAAFYTKGTATQLHPAMLRSTFSQDCAILEG